MLALADDQSQCRRDIRGVCTGVVAVVVAGVESAGHGPAAGSEPMSTRAGSVLRPAHGTNSVQLHGKRIQPMVAADDEAVGSVGSAARTRRPGVRVEAT